MKYGKSIKVKHKSATFKFRQPNAKELCDLLRLFRSEDPNDLEARFRRIFDLLESIEGVSNGSLPKTAESFIENYDEIPGTLILEIAGQAATVMVGGEAKQKKIALPAESLDA